MARHMQQGRAAWVTPLFCTPFRPCSNMERTKMRPDPKKMSTDGFALNLALVGRLAVLCVLG